MTFLCSTTCLFDSEDIGKRCSEETGEAKSEIFRKVLKSYYENAKYFKNVLQVKEERSEEDLPYICFNTREEAMQYVNKIKSTDDSIEFTLWDGDLPPELIQ